MDNNSHIDNLKKARGLLVGARRMCVNKLALNLSEDRATELVRLQGQIEAVDKAIDDEEKMQHEYPSH